MTWMQRFNGWMLLIGALMGLALLVPPQVFEVHHAQFLLLVGAVGLWRYSVGLTHYVRGLWFRYVIFPRHKRQALVALKEQPPSHIYLMVTSFRIDAETGHHQIDMRW